MINDIALIKLNKKLTKAQIVCLPDRKKNRDVILNKKSLVIGW